LDDFWGALRPKNHPTSSVLCYSYKRAFGRVIDRFMR
jgi:hypothetical protein